MGFGSYDESEQQRSTESADVEDDGGVKSTNTTITGRCRSTRTTRRPTI